MAVTQEMVQQEVEEVQVTMDVPDQCHQNPQDIMRVEVVPQTDTRTVTTEDLLHQTGTEVVVQYSPENLHHTQGIKSLIMFED